MEMKKKKKRKKKKRVSSSTTLYASNWSGEQNDHNQLAASSVANISTVNHDRRNQFPFLPLFFQFFRCLCFSLLFPVKAAAAACLLKKLTKKEEKANQLSNQSLSLPAWVVYCSITTTLLYSLLIILLILNKKITNQVHTLNVWWWCRTVSTNHEQQQQWTEERYQEV